MTDFTANFTFSFNAWEHVLIVALGVAAGILIVALAETILEFFSDLFSTIFEMFKNRRK